MKLNAYIIPALTCLAVIAASSAGYTQDNVVQASIIDLDAQAISKNLLCDTLNVLRGDLGLMLGLLVGFIGFIIITTRELNISGIILIIFGVTITALPDFFISTINGIVGMGNGIFSQTNIIAPC